MAIRRFSVLTLAMIFAFALTVSADSITSVYSSLSGCKLVAKGRDWSTQACRGVGGYNLRLEYGDVRESITVISPNGKKHPLEFWNVIGSGFSNVGQKAEWRVIKKNGKMVPIALIIRFNVTENAADSTKDTSYLAVAKITPQKICVTDKIPPGATANADARAAADAAADKPCLEPPQSGHASAAGQSVTAAGSFIIAAHASSAPAGMPYVGRWSNGRGETLIVAKRMLKFNNDKSVTFRDVTKVTDGNHFSLQITSRGKLNYFTKFIALSLENDEMKMTLYDSYTDMFNGNNPQGESTWYRDK